MSIALANAEAVGHQQRAPAVTRRLALGGRMDESGEGVYESSGDGGVDEVPARGLRSRVLRMRALAL